MDFLIEASAGTIGGVLGVLVGSPFDIVKTRLQAEGSASLTGAKATSSLEHAAHIMRQDGLRGFFRGSIVASLSQAPNNFLSFGVYSWTQSTLLALRTGGTSSSSSASSAMPRSSLWDTYIAGCSAGLAQSIALSPFEQVKVQQQLSPHLTLRETSRLIWKTRTFMRGWVATAFRDAPTYGLYFATFEGTKEWYARVYWKGDGGVGGGGGLREASAAAWGDGTRRTFEQRHEQYGSINTEYDSSSSGKQPRVLGGSSTLTNNVSNNNNNNIPPPTPTAQPFINNGEAVARRHPSWVLLLGGALAGLASWSLAIPMDVIKSNIQGSPLEKDPKELKFFTVGARLYREHGLSVFVRGMAPCLIRSIPVNAVTFLVYDWTLWEAKRLLY